MFRIVLSHSRKAYSEVVWRQTTDEFIAAIENAFHQFGGVPKRLVIDNLKAAVKRADWYDPEVRRLRSIRNLLKRPAPEEQQSIAFLEEHPIIRPLSDYSLASLNAFRKERNS